MILVDSSVWIDLLTDRTTPQTEVLERIWQERRLGVGDLVLMEVLQGCRDERRFERARTLLGRFEAIDIAGHSVALAAARHYRQLRGLGITVRKTIDTLIATRCILDSIPLLYSDRDFDPFVAHLGLRSAMDEFPGVS